MFNLKLTALAGLILFAAACRKKDKSPEPQVPYGYKSLQNTEVRYTKPYSLDFDGDGEEDVFFTVSLLHDDEGTHARFVAVALKSAKLLSLVDTAVRLNNADPIPAVPDYPRQWGNFTKHLLEVIVPDQPAADTIWRGSWVAADKKFLGAQFRISDEPYMGWVSISADTARDCIILHDCAWRPLKGGDIAAGRR